MVQDEFGDRIRIGDGDEVEAVVHPVAPGSEAVYDFLLADSVTLSLPATTDTVRVYEVQVRPQDFDVPGFVGSVYLDRATKAIVRMNFTFTPASYVDYYLDHISISLENGLWEGRHWLPLPAKLEIRREMPYLDIPAGSVIRGSFEVRDYQINPPLPTNPLLGPAITALPEARGRPSPSRRTFTPNWKRRVWEVSFLLPRWTRSAPWPFPSQRSEYLSGLGRTRLFLPSPFVSSVLRYNRAEGLGPRGRHLPYASPQPRAGSLTPGFPSVGSARSSWLGSMADSGYRL